MHSQSPNKESLISPASPESEASVSSSSNEVEETEVEKSHKKKRDSDFLTRQLDDDFFYRDKFSKPE